MQRKKNQKFGPVRLEFKFMTRETGQHNICLVGQDLHPKPVGLKIFCGFSMICRKKCVNMCPTGTLKSTLATGAMGRYFVDTPTTVVQGPGKIGCG
mgnify:CR=1 FL=1